MSYIRKLEDFDIAPGTRAGGRTPPPYPNAWFRVANSRDVARGQVRYVEMLGQRLAVFRGAGGVVSVVDAYCPHLGANLAVGGRVVGDCLECPFHGWRFDAGGRCVAIPYAAAGRAVPEQARVRRYESAEVNGAVLVWHDGEGRAPAWQPGRFVDDGMVFHGEARHVIRTHISESPENGPDTAHLGFLHMPFEIPWLTFAIKHKWDASWVPDAVEKHRAIITVRHAVSLFGWEIKPITVTVRIHQVGPGMVALRFPLGFGDIVIMEYVSPLAPLMTEVIHLVYASRLVPRALAKFILAGTVGMFERDITIWNNKTYQHRPLLVRDDGPIALFRRWYRQFYSPIQYEQHDAALAAAAAALDSNQSPDSASTADGAGAAEVADEEVAAVEKDTLEEMGEGQSSGRKTKGYTGTAW